MSGLKKPGGSRNYGEHAGRTRALQHDEQQRYKARRVFPMNGIYDLRAYDYELPEELIAQEPAASRENSRLLVLDRDTGLMLDRRFPDLLEHLTPGDTLVLNDTRVFPARLLGRKESGGKAELLLLEFPRLLAEKEGNWRLAEVCGLVKSSKRPAPGSIISFGEPLRARVEKLLPGGKMAVRLLYQGELRDLLDRYGRIPLPPYIRRPEGESVADRERYQTVYAASTGAVAAPTAGLHFSDDLLAAIRKKGVRTCHITLHVGYGTFAPVRTEDIRQHRIHAEHLSVSAHTAQLVNETRAAGGKIWAVGTTTARGLEFAVDTEGKVKATEDWCDLYIYPGYQFKVVNNLITNFHLPRSSLLFMISALAGREQILRSYSRAIDLGYRFYSYGDAMAILT
jgi:S-adenosylmethionine:tRNA ribosyltransferase-isomerase